MLFSIPSWRSFLGNMAFLVWMLQFSSYIWILIKPVSTFKSFGWLLHYVDILSSAVRSFVDERSVVIHICSREALNWQLTRSCSIFYFHVRFKLALRILLYIFVSRPKMSSSCFTSLAFIACLFVYAYAHERPEQERDHLSVGIMRKPDDCPRESKDGDHLTVRYNNTLIDQTPILTTRWARTTCFRKYNLSVG